MCPSPEHPLVTSQRVLLRVKCSKEKKVFPVEAVPAESVFPEAQAPGALGSKINGKSFLSGPKSCPCGSELTDSSPSSQGPGSGVHGSV